MQSVSLLSLQPGASAQYDYYSERGELLIAKGTLLTERHFEVLYRRVISEVYTHEVFEDNELHRIITRDFKVLDELELDETGIIPGSRPANPPPELAGLKPGRAGLDQLIADSRIREVESRIELEILTDRPDGQPFNTRITQLAVQERTDAYKHATAQSFNNALHEVEGILGQSLAGNTAVDGTQVGTVVSRFMKTFSTDRNILFNLTNIKNGTHDYLTNHALNVCLLSLSIATAAGYSERQVAQIGMSALLHDIGMMLVPEEIRVKQGRLSADEWYEIQKHPVFGLHILERIEHLPDVVPMVAYQSHERENGKGYPRQRTGRLIHSYAKIVQCADIFDAVSSPRTYREAIAPYRGVEMLLKMVNQGLLNGSYVKSFLLYASLFPVGSVVELNDHRVGRVVATNGASFTKPVVSVLVDEAGISLAPDAVYQVDLKLNPGLQVVRSHRLDFLKGVGVMDGF